MKFTSSTSPLGNNDLEKFLESQDCEVNCPGSDGLCAVLCTLTWAKIMLLYGGKLGTKVVIDQFAQLSGQH